MKATFRPDEAERSFPAEVWVSFLCLIVMLAAACSVDIGKLRGPNSRALDGSLDRPVVPDASEAGSDNTDSSGGSVDADSASVLPDLPAADEVALPNDARDLPEMDVAEDVVAPEDVSDSLDLPTTDEDTRGAGVDGGGETGGTGGTGTGGAGIDGGGTGGAGMDGGGTGGAGGGGTGGAGIDGGGGTGGAGMDGGRTGGAGMDGAGTGGAGMDGGGGTGGAGGGGRGGTGGADPDLVLWYKFDESSGTTATDSSPSGSGTHDGTLATYGMGGSAAFSTDHQVGTHALSLIPSTSDPSAGGGYVTVPALQTLAPNALTIAVWVKLAAATTTQNWERVFDFGTDTSSTTGPYCYMTSRSTSTNTPVRFGISPSGRTTNMQRLEGTSALTANAWHHIAIVLPAGAIYTGTMYIDGVVVATNNAMTLHMSDLATTTNNWLGRSTFGGSAGGDPFFYGSLDDFRVYKRALSQPEISALFALR